MTAQYAGRTDLRLRQIIAAQEEIFVRHQQWLISVQHDGTDIDRLIENFGVFAQAVSTGADAA